MCPVGFRGPLEITYGYLTSLSAARDGYIQEEIARFLVLERK